MRWVALAFLLVVSLVLETTLFNWLTIFGAQPDLVLILVVFFALFSGSSGGAFFGFLGGLAQDALVGQYLGLNALTKLVIGFSVAQIERKIYKDYPLLLVIIVFLVSVAGQIMVYLLLAPFTAEPPFTQVLFYMMLPAGGYNSLVAGLTYNRFRRSITRGWLKPTDY